jgi:SAM-dependent methyltransferase
MLLGDLRQQVYETHPEFFSKHQFRLPEHWLPQDDHPSTVARQTQTSFGFEWSTFSAIRPEWEQNFWGYLAPHRADFFRGKTILDAGCGMGRHLYFSGQWAKEAIGVDFSCAVDVAQRNTRHLPHAHVVQADLLQLPFRQGVFDFIYSLGVLHHVPQADEALQRLLRHLKVAGQMRVYVYWSLDDAARWKRSLLALVSALRKVTTRLPHRALGWLCYPIAAGAWLAFVLPYRGLSHYESTRRLAEALPLKQYSQYPFYVLLNDQFDRFSAPLERRYRPEELRHWLRSAGLTDVTIVPHWGWIGDGRKADPSNADAERDLEASMAGIHRASGQNVKVTERS